MKIYLHIGTRKTGTSSVQSLGRENTALLAERGYYWPLKIEGVEMPQHGRIARFIREGDPDRSKKIIDTFIKEAEDAGLDKMILSSEGMHILEPDQLKTLLSFMEGHEIKAILFIRNIYDYVKSEMLQVTKNAISDRPLVNLVDHIVRDVDFNSVIEKWEAALSPDQVAVYAYETYKNDIFGQLLRAADIQVTSEYRARFKAPERNVSIEPGLHFLLASIGFYEINMHFHKFDSEDIRAFNQHKAYNIYMYQLVELLLKNADLTFPHPKLQAISKTLLKKPEMDHKSHMDSEKNYAYLRAIGMLTLKLYYKHRYRLFKRTPLYRYTLGAIRKLLHV